MQNYLVTTKTLMGFDLEIIDIVDFKDYYNDHAGLTLSGFAEKAFLKAVGIPANYYLEQPDETKTELLDNKESIISQKYPDKHLLILKKDGVLLNCCRVDLDAAVDLLERLTTSNDFKRTVVKDFIKEGYSSVFYSTEDLKAGQYNLGVYIDTPIMLNKAPQIHSGLFYVPKEGEEQYKNLYLDSTDVDFNDYADLDLLIEDKLEEISELDVEEIEKSLSSVLVLKEVEEVITLLVKEKFIPKNYIKTIVKYVEKEDIQLTSVYSYVDLLLSYEDNLGSYSAVTKIRQAKKFLLKLIEPKEVGKDETV